MANYEAILNETFQLVELQLVMVKFRIHLVTFILEESTLKICFHYEQAEKDELKFVENLKVRVQGAVNWLRNNGLCIQSELVAWLETNRSESVAKELM